MTLRFRAALAAAAAAALTGGLLSMTAGQASALAKGAFVDFNDDGYADVAYSAGNAYVNGRQGAGQIVVQYGSANGLTSANRQTFSQDTAGVAGAAEKYDGFGWTSAVGDFNNDGYDDLAVGAKYETIGTDVDAGIVHLFFGSGNGLTSGAALVDPAPGNHDFWGNSLASGDFDGDGSDDLAVGSDHAKTYVFKGGTTSASTFAGYYSITPAFHSGSDDGGPYGVLMMFAGDVTGDGKDDIVMDGFGTATTQGWNTNFYYAGSDTGLGGAPVQLSSGIITGIGDINGDTYGDIVTGVEWDANETPDASTGGKVVVRYGTPWGPDVKQVVTQNSGSVPGGSEDGDGFGGELSLGDVNGDGYQDLAVGALGENLTDSSGVSIANSGCVTILYGTADGLNVTSGVQFFEQNTTGVPSVGEKNDYFGSEVKLADVTGDGKADLTVGSIGENVFNGALTVLKSDGAKITTTGSAIFGPTYVGVSAEGSPVFGGNAAN